MVQARRAGGLLASKILAGFVSPYDSTSSSGCKRAGAVIIGRSNMDEFAMGSSTENSIITARPQPLGSRAKLRRLLGRLCGCGRLGASWGLHRSAATPAARSASPASFCGVVGHQAHLRARLALGARGLRLLPRSDRLLHSQRTRTCAWVLRRSRDTTHATPPRFPSRCPTSHAPRSRAT